jgi:hypothetical protein
MDWRLRMINDYKNETESTQIALLFNSVFDRGRLVEVLPNQIVASCENCSITIVDSLEDAQALHPDKEIEPLSEPYDPMAKARERQSLYNIDEEVIE